jgi:hypothetical protein
MLGNCPLGNLERPQYITLQYRKYQRMLCKQLLRALIHQQDKQGNFQYKLQHYHKYHLKDDKQFLELQIVQQDKQIVVQYNIRQCRKFHLQVGKQSSKERKFESHMKQ